MKKSFLNSVRFFILLSLSQILGIFQVNALNQDIIPRFKRENISKEVLAFDSLSRVFWFTDLDSSLYYGTLGLEYAKKYGSQRDIAQAYNAIGNIYTMNYKYEEAFRNYQESYSHWEKGGDFVNAAVVLFNSGLILRGQQNYSDAISTFKKAAELCHTANDYYNEAIMQMNVALVYRIINKSVEALNFAINSATNFMHTESDDGLAYVYLFIGNIHRNLKNFNLSLEYYQKSHQYYKLLEHHYGIANTLNNLGIIYFEMKEYDKALAYYEEYLQMSIENDDPLSQSTAYNNIGFLHSNLHEYPKALDAYLKSISISKKMQDSASVMNTYNNIASVYLNTKDLKMAENYVNKGLIYQTPYTDFTYIAESHEILSKIYEEQQNYKKAYHHQSLNFAFKDSIYTLNTNQQIVQLQYQFEADQKEREIELLKKNDEIKNLKLQKQRSLNAVWIFLVTLLLGIGGLVYFNLLQKKKRNSLLQAKNAELKLTNEKLKESEKHLKELIATKDKLFGIIAHDLKNPFNALIGFSELLTLNYDKYELEQGKNIATTIHETSLQMYDLLENLLQWSISQSGTIQYNPKVFPIIEVIKEEIETSSSIWKLKNIQIVNLVKTSTEVYADKHLISVILRNLLNNAIKFSYPDGEIQIVAEQENDTIKVCIKDSGVGMSKQQLDKLFKIDQSSSTLGTTQEKGTGLGLIVCKEFVEKNGGTITATSIEGQGSIFCFTLPSTVSP